jgi:MarR family transcriptional regulator, organic hydroperoxide resistance regulator
MPRRSRLQQELRQSRPFRTPEQECLVGLLRTTDLVRRALARVVEPHGLTLQQYNVLRILRGAGPGGLPTLEIAERMIEQAPGVTRLLDRLDRKRLAVRDRCRSDRRQVLCRLTPAGARLLAAIDEPILAADRTCLGGLAARDVARLIRLLDAVRAGHDAAAPQPDRAGPRIETRAKQGARQPGEMTMTVTEVTKRRKQ